VDRKGIFSVGQGKRETNKVKKVIKRDVMTRNRVMLIPYMQPCVQSVENSDKIANCVTRV
jgi:hypothetical protein